MMKDEVIELAPLAIRPSEMQHATIEQTKMILIHLWYNWRMVITGDLMQSDLMGHAHKNRLGLADILRRIELLATFGEPLSQWCSDVVRHEAVSEV
jgi:phosphate starvation-inducible protein PhoH